MSKNQNKHDMYIDNLINLIEKEEIIFKDQYGNSHKVFSNKENEFMYRESVYFRNYIEPTLHNPNFPCQFIKDDTSTFKPYCNFDIGKDKILKENKCLDCLKNAESHFYKRQDFLRDNTYIPDIAIGEDSKFKYWIEVVNSHGCTKQKREFIKSRGFTVLEIHIYQIKERQSHIIECFNITNTDDNEYNNITETFKEFSKLTKEPRKARQLKGKDNQDISNNQEHLVELHSYIDEIFLAVGEERFMNGQSLDYNKFIDTVRQNCKVINKTPSIASIESYLRSKHQCSILNLDGDGYPLVIVEQFNFQKRKSIVHTKVSKLFMKELKKFRRIEYIKSGYKQEE